MTPRWLALLPLVLLPCLPSAASGAAPRDRDGDRLPDRWERKHHISTTKKSAKGDPDRDGLRNRREYRLRTNPRRKDTDRDGLRDGAEVRRYHTNPRKRDTDGDGYSDRAEILAGTNPRDRRSHPTSAATDPGGSTTPPASSPALPALPVPPGFPSALDTGVPAGTSLETVNGYVTLSTPGQVFADKLVNGCIDVTAPNVTIRRVKVVCTDTPGIKSSSVDLVVEDAEIDMGDRGGRTAIGDANYTARRVNAHGGENILWVEHDVTIEDSYIHDPIDYDPATDPHTDGVQMPSGAAKVTINRNTIYGNYVNTGDFGNSAITTGGGTIDISITNNLLAGGGYTVYCNQPGRGSGFVFANNRFSRIYTSKVGGFGPWDECRDEQISGNVYYESGQPL